MIPLAFAFLSLLAATLPSVVPMQTKLQIEILNALSCIFVLTSISYAASDIWRSKNAK